MIPDTPRDFVPSSLEGTMFDGLAKLPSDYYVFHSFRIITVEENVIKESETDFVVFHPAKGILVIEAKAGHVRYSDGRWLYGSGDEMAYGGPFNQGRRYVRRILQLFEKERMGALSRKCKVLSSVWFPSVSNDEFSTVNLPSEASREAVMLKEDVFDPAERIERIFELGVPGGITTELSPIEAKSILSRILAPSFDLYHIIDSRYRPWQACFQEDDRRTGQGVRFHRGPGICFDQWGGGNRQDGSGHREGAARGA